MKIKHFDVILSRVTHVALSSCSASETKLLPSYLEDALFLFFLLSALLVCFLSRAHVS